MNTITRPWRRNMSPKSYMCPKCEKLWQGHEIKLADDLAKLGKYPSQRYVYCPECYGVAYWVFDLKARAEKYDSLYETYTRIKEQK
jgi:hypothetical protein